MTPVRFPVFRGTVDNLLLLPTLRGPLPPPPISCPSAPFFCGFFSKEKKTRRRQGGAPDNPLLDWRGSRVPPSPTFCQMRCLITLTLPPLLQCPGLPGGPPSVRPSVRPHPSRTPAVPSGPRMVAREYIFAALRHPHRSERPPRCSAGPPRPGFRDPHNLLPSPC